MSTEPTEPKDASSRPTLSARTGAIIAACVMAIGTVCASLFQPVVAARVAPRPVPHSGSVQRPSPPVTRRVLPPDSARDFRRVERASPSPRVPAMRPHPIRHALRPMHAVPDALPPTPSAPSNEEITANRRRAVVLLDEATVLSMAAALDERAGERVVDAIPFVLSSRDSLLAGRTRALIRNNQARDPELRLRSLQRVSPQMIQQLDDLANGRYSAPESSIEDDRRERARSTSERARSKSAPNRDRGEHKRRRPSRCWSRHLGWGLLATAGVVCSSCTIPVVVTQPSDTLTRARTHLAAVATNEADASPAESAATDAPQLSFVVRSAANRPVGSIFWDLTLDCEPLGRELRLCCYDHPDVRCPTPRGECEQMPGQWLVPWPQECPRVNFMTLTATPGIQCAPVRIRERPMSRESRDWVMEAVCDISMSPHD